MKRLGLVTVVLALLTGCSAQYTSNGEQQYLNSRNGVNPVVPAPLTPENISHFYDLPAQNQDAHVSVAPPANE